MLTCPALLLAFALAPFEHVHAGAGAGHGVIHAHFFEIHLPHGVHDGVSFDDIDDDHASTQQLETFVPLAAANWIPCVPALERVPAIQPVVTDEPVIAVEECGHDPPAIRCFPPRPPPV